ncbi:MAG TPA: 2TM domain-containing protein [Gaiellaceae bacterium]|nr:2TM domain-containing protein [Gaiellaceae bacterium]
MLTAEEYKRAEFDLTLADLRRGFKIHALVFAIVMTGLITLNALLWAFTDGDFPWAVFPLVGWGIGLTFHYLDAYRREGRSIRARQDEVEAYAERLKTKEPV